MYCRACGKSFDTAAIDAPPRIHRPRTLDRLWRIAAIGFAVVTVALLARQRGAVSILPRPVTQTAPVSEDIKLGSIIRQARPAVVTLVVYDQRGKELGFGSGFFTSRTGEILTNHHVLVGASSAKARTSDGVMHPVEVVLADDPKSDLARVLIFADEDTPHLPIAAERPQVGDRVIVMGSPMGLDETVTEGIVSAVPEQRAGQSD